MAASAAANIITNRAIACPAKPKFPNLENATKLILAALRTSSIPIKTITAFLRVTIPYMPNENKTALTIKKCVKPTCNNSILPFNSVPDF